MMVTEKDEQSIDQADGDTGLPSGYGEITPDGVLEMLCRVHAQPGERYYDLGSGTGKTAAIAWLQGMHATGVELSKVRWDLGCKALDRLRNKSAAAGQLRFIHGSFMDVDISDADVVFADSVLFNHHMMSALSNMASFMKPGARIVSAQELPGASKWFETVEKFSVPCSWTEDESTPHPPVLTF